MTRAYELMIILDGELDEPVAQSRLKSLSDAITAAGGSIQGKADWWGKRRFAFPINKKQDGYYVVYNLTAAGGALDDFERSLRIADDVVRHKLFRLPEAEAERRGLLGGAPAA